MRNLEANFEHHIFVPLDCQKTFCSTKISCAITIPFHFYKETGRSGLTTSTLSPKIHDRSIRSWRLVKHTKRTTLRPTRLACQCFSVPGPLHGFSSGRPGPSRPFATRHSTEHVKATLPTSCADHRSQFRRPFVSISGVVVGS